MSASHRPLQEGAVAPVPWEDTVPMGEQDAPHHSAPRRHRRHLVAHAVLAVMDAMKWVSLTVFKRSTRHVQRRRHHSLKRRQGLPNLELKTDRKAPERRIRSRRQTDRRPSRVGSGGARAQTRVDREI